MDKTEARAWPPPGAGQASYVYQNVGAWNHASNLRRRIRKGGVFVYQCKIRKSATIDGVFAMYLEPYNNANPSVLNTVAAKRYRNSADQILYTGVLFSDNPSPEILLYNADIFDYGMEVVFCDPRARSGPHDDARSREFRMARRDDRNDLHQ